MAASVVPHFANDQGVERIRVGVHALNGMGARAPFDHPHVFLDMGAETEILCPYCSTVYAYDAGLEPTQSEPADCVVVAHGDAKAHA